MPLIYLLLILLPVLEVYVFIKVGIAYGFFNTLLVMLATSIAGVLILRYQGFSVLRRMQKGGIRGGRNAIMPLWNGICVFIAAILLIFPGFMTDILGLLLLLPFVRYFLFYVVADSVSGLLTGGFFTYSSFEEVRTTARDSKQKADDKVMEADFDVVREDVVSEEPLLKAEKTAGKKAPKAHKKAQKAAAKEGAEKKKASKAPPAKATKK